MQSSDGQKAADHSVPVDAAPQLSQPALIWVNIHARRRRKSEDGIISHDRMAAPHAIGDFVSWAAFGTQRVSPHGDNALL
jgi:hypothetical protein